MNDPADLQRRFELILAQSRKFGDGGREVLETAYHTLACGQTILRWPDVGLEDLWTHAIKEGGILFNKPDARWSKTGPAETKDMIGQTTIGPWQITVQNVKNKFGQPYGVGPDWPDGDVFTFCKAPGDAGWHDQRLHPGSLRPVRPAQPVRHPKVLLARSVREKRN